MSSRFDELGSGPPQSRSRSLPAGDFRPVVLQSRYYLSAYLRFLASLLMLAGVYVLPARLFYERMFGRAVQRWVEGIAHPPPPDFHRNVDPFFVFWGPDLPVADLAPFRSGLHLTNVVEGYLHLLETLVSLWPLTVALVVGGLLALALEWRS